MAIKKVQLPDNSMQDINDERIASTDIARWNGKQDALVSGTNIKTVNNESLLGSGNLEIQSGGGTEHNLHVSPSAVFKTTDDSGAGGDSLRVSEQLYSSRKFTWSSLKNVAVIIRSVYNRRIQNNSAGGSLTPFGLYQSETTYLQLYYYAGVQLKCKLVVNGTTTQDVQLIANVNSQLTKYADYAFAFDKNAMTLQVYGYDTTNNAIIIIAECDISQWDLSSLTNVYVATNTMGLTSYVCCTTVLVNSPLTLGDYIAAPLNVGVWNSPEGTPYDEDLYLAGTGIEVGGTISQTVSDTDKVTSISNASVDYFKLGPSDFGNDWQYMWYHVKLRFSSVGEGMYITGGRFWQKVIIEDADGMPVATLKTDSDKWYPAVDTDYHLYYQFVHTSNDAVFGQTHQRNNGLKLYGTATLEASEPYMYNPQVQNLCAETYNGAGFDGAIPFDGKCEFVDYKVTMNYTPANQRIPQGAIWFDTSNHRIYMWEGSVWKQINNS